jgi:hypothetical protein
MQVWIASNSQQRNVLAFACIHLMLALCKSILIWLMVLIWNQNGSWVLCPKESLFSILASFHQPYAAPTAFPVTLVVVQDQLMLNRTPQLIVGQEWIVFVRTVLEFRVTSIVVAHFWSTTTVPSAICSSDCLSCLACGNSRSMDVGSDA